MRIKKYRILRRGRAHPARSPAENAILRKGRRRDIPHPYRAAGSSVTGSTKEDSTEVQTETLSITASPLPSGIVKVKTGTNTTNAVYDAWYSSVYEPSASVSSGE